MSYIEPLLPAMAQANAVLSSAQKEQLMEVFVRNRSTVRLNPSDIGMSGRMDWEAVVAQTGGILSPVQHAVLKSYASQRRSSRSSP